MMTMIAIVSLKADYIYKANITYQNLIEYEDLFYKEAVIINYVKCALMQEVELDDFNINGINVYVSRNRDKYILEFDSKRMELSVFDKQVVNIEYS